MQSNNLSISYVIYTNFLDDLLPTIRFMRNVDDKQEFLFALRLADDTGVTDVIVHGDDAKKFLFLPKLRNISPTFDGEFQDKVLEQLEAIKKTQILFEVHLRMYSSVERSRGELARRVRSDV